MNINNDKHRREIATRLRNFQFEKMGDGRILLGAGTGAVLGGAFRHRLIRPDGSSYDEHIDCNRVVPEGLNYLLNVAFLGQAQITSFFVALFSGNVNPDDTWTAANFEAKANEFTAYAGGQRPAWVIGNVPTTNATVGNAGNEALFTFDAGGPYSIYGAALLSDSVREGGTGKLIAATRFTVPRTNQLGNDRLGVEYQFTAVDAG